MRDDAPPLALTMGEPAGIGGEIALMAWRQLKGEGPCFFALDDPARLKALARELSLDVTVEAVERPDQAPAVFPRALPAIAIPLDAAQVPGRLDRANAAAVIASIREAVRHAMAGDAAAVVTSPIHKAALKAAGFAHPGHTEFLAELAGIRHEPVMMLAGPRLRVVPVTIHMALARVPVALTAERIVAAGRITAEALSRDFGIARPRLAVAGLNPHAGESGMLGSEDDAIVRPAVEALVAEGIEAKGPLAADSMFHDAARRTYDAALCMYHDQALIPVKTLDFEETVNVTLGLPFVRTSPDHGTALDIAGTGRASPASLVAALRLAAEMAARRREHG